MKNPHPLLVAYVVKRYPRFSETFIVQELLAHEAAGHALEVVSLYPSNDTHFQDVISRVRAPVTCLAAEGIRAPDLWESLEAAAARIPGMWSRMDLARGVPAREVYQAARLALRVQARGIGLLHAHFATASAEVARLAAGWAGIPYTVTAHAKDIFHESVRPEDLRRRLGDAARVFTVSDFNAEHLRDAHGAAAARIGRLYNGIELDRFPFTPPVNRPRHLVAVGRLVEKKGFLVLLEACGILAGRGVAFTCDLVGMGPMEAALRERITALGLTQAVRLTGALPQVQVIRTVQGAAALVAPCIVAGDGDADGMPTVLLEAMALGTPCVSTPVTGIPEIVRDGETGLLSPCGDAARLADALERLLDDPSLGVRLATAARQRVERDFDITRNAAVQWECFRQAAARRPAPRESSALAA